ncbi:MAG: tyrosine--tRNA ligase [Candidatus Omnitrophota bacterium]|nr:MAG: tyrosine--tRNA ligase [Candidatus Omnitrophota bacterium]
MNKEVSSQIDIIKENAVDFISQEELRAKLKKSLKTKQPLKLKIGFDPTARDIHLGHTVILRKLRKLQDLGHIVYFIIGDFTAKIGDPSGRTLLRPILSDKEIADNAATYTRQAFKILDKKKTRIIYNSIWYKKMKLSQFLSLLSSYTVARLLERDDFSQRMKEGRPLTMLEAVYPLIQGYDSCKMEADIEFGGTDQKFNLIVGRHIQQAAGQLPQAVVTMPLLVGLDGKNKMSKSLDNYVGITNSAKSMFGKIMSIPDDIMWDYFRLLTDCNLEDARKMHPKEAKSYLAQRLVSLYHCDKAAKREREEFQRVFSQKELPKDLAVYQAQGRQINLVEVLYKTKLVSSKNEARRLLTQGGISLIDVDNPSRVTVAAQQSVKIPAKGIVLKVGKKKFLKVAIE